MAGPAPHGREPPGSPETPMVKRLAAEPRAGKFPAPAPLRSVTLSTDEFLRILLGNDFLELDRCAAGSQGVI